MKPTRQLHVLRQSLWLDDNNSGGIAIAHLCCVNSKAVSEEPSAGLRAGELPVVFNLV